VFTGNPVRQNLKDATIVYKNAIEQFGLDEKKRTVLIVGGSLGARTINESVLSCLELIRQQDEVQFIWQTGGYYHAEITETLRRAGCPENLVVTDFISDMASAYAVSDLVISRAGAGSISEFCLLGKPVILVPSPNVAEDHQTKNALALANKNAAIMIADNEAREKLVGTVLSTVKDTDRLNQMAQNVRQLALENSDEKIVDHVLEIIHSKH
jgi:UDP-N-acetylglucosamine--N-acetylmuramyl-(pentapeptide) pyrophosphoryl-undecaprenol N-acetylglucosamine transferase